MNLAASIAVIPVSYEGQTSTTSIPIIRGAIPLIISRTSTADKPKGSGVDTPGAWEGSIASISMLK